MFKPVSSLLLKSIKPQRISQLRFASGGAIDSSLINKLKEEIKFEQENVNECDWLNDFKSQGVWKIIDTPGTKEVSLERSFGNEKITAIFSTDSLSESEMEDSESVDAENEEAPESPIAVSIIITKGSEGALEINSTSQGESFYIEDVAFVKSAELALDQTAQGDWVRRGAFGGPVFNDLDESLVDIFHKYIEERGFNKELAEFINEYTLHKEQEEYTRWLKNVSKFVGQ